MGVFIEDKLLHIDGSFGEGGGQILRTALSLSIIFLKPIKIINIRAKRPKPGLQPQHLACVKACREISSAETKGEELFSQELLFIPKSYPQRGTFYFDIGTAGSTSLLFQTLFYPLAFSQGATLILKGGTHVPHAPTFHYLEKVYLPVIASFGFKCSIYLEKIGFYPKGGGKIKAIIEKSTSLHLPHFTPAFRLEKAKILSLSSDDLPAHIVERQAKASMQILREAQIEAIVETLRLPSDSPGTILFLYGIDQEKRAGFTAFGKKGIPAEKIGEEATKEFLHFLSTNTQFDPYLGDQLLLPSTLVLLKSGEKYFTYTVSKITQHLLTQAWLIPQFLDNIKIKVEGEIGNKGEVALERT
ncbi:MAG: RNA 3'-terminal phosphate cyclase [Caldimicrobium sp.]